MYTLWISHDTHMTVRGQDGEGPPPNVHRQAPASQDQRQAVPGCQRYPSVGGPGYSGSPAHLTGTRATTKSGYRGITWPGQVGRRLVELNYSFVVSTCIIDRVWYMYISNMCVWLWHCLLTNHALVDCRLKWKICLFNIAHNWVRLGTGSLQAVYTS